MYYKNTRAGTLPYGKVSYWILLYDQQYIPMPVRWHFRWLHKSDMLWVPFLFLTFLFFPSNVLYLFFGEEKEEYELMNYV
jgi:hypothetical protein